MGIPAAGAGGRDEAIWDRWHKWFDAITERGSLVSTWSTEEQYINVYKRYAEDTTQSEVAQATRQGKRLP